jgi:decaprenyl-phosphate phosphoribosyltransferase
MKNYLTLLRPHQWIKNLFILAPMFFSFDFSQDRTLQVFSGFIIFCLTSSAIYILNDYHDIPDDRDHPVKRLRPLAASLVSKKSAVVLIIILLAVSLSSGVLISIKFSGIMIVYLVLNIAYTFWLKHIPILDITIIAIGFVLRIFAGTILINSDTSMWIVLVTFMLALFLALAKRRDDCLLSIEGKKTRKNIDGYSIEMINAAMVLMAGVTIVAYIMYTVTPEVMTRMGSNKLYLTVLFVVMGILRYMQITFVEENSGSPTKLMLKDRFLQFTVIGWLVCFYAIHRFKDL